MSKEERLGNEQRTPEERQENARRAGIESGKSRRRKKTMREAAELMLNSPERDEEYIKLLEAMGCTKSSEMTNLMSIMAAMIQKAKRGDVKAANFIKDIVADTEEEKLKRQRLEFEMKKFEHLNTDKPSAADEWISVMLELDEEEKLNEEEN